MAPPLQGRTLGERQKFYNKLVDTAIRTKTGDIPKISFNDDDVDNMIRIDMACRERNVEYILDVFKCEDMMYVSRALNQSTWLITDAEYAHIINPQHLHRELFPQMNAKAVTKLMLQIRRHLKDEARVLLFYKYVKETNPDAAFRWLINCPMGFIKKTVIAQAKEIPPKMQKRLLRKSKDMLSIYARKTGSDSYDINDTIKNATFLLKNKDTAEDFLDIMLYCDNAKYCFSFQLNRKFTNIAMKKFPTKIKEQFSVFCKHIDIGAFANCLKLNEIKPFLLSVSGTSYWRCFETLTPFLNKLPREDILDFLKMLYRIKNDDTDEDISDPEEIFSLIEGRTNNASNIYRWYQFIPFDLAFHDIKKLIFAESSPEERHSLLLLLLTCGSNSEENLATVLKYYHDQHINEPFIHKKTFIASVLSRFYAFRFNENQWNTLNALFHSSEVYIESTNDVQEALKAIIARNVLNDMPIHEVVEEKFKIDTLEDLKRELKPEEQDKVFNYLHNLLMKKINQQSTNSETGMHKTIELVKMIWTLINDWDRVESHHRFIIEKISELGDINKASSWVQEMHKNQRRKRRKKKLRRDWRTPRYLNKDNDKVYIHIPSLYKMLKSYRKNIFEKSLVLHPNEEVMLNALKHDPGLLTRYKSDVDRLRSNDEISLNKFLSKLRIYWMDSLALEWIDINRNCLKKLSGHRSLVRGILTLMPRNKALHFIKMYSPQEKKIQWSEFDEIELTIQKNIAKNMHIVRPQLPAEVVLWYAKGDYLQYALLSLCTMYYNLRKSDIQKYITLMLNAPVSLQKHGIRLVFAKYSTEEKLVVAAESWKKTKNSSIRVILFTSLFNLLCKEKKPMTIKAIWQVLSVYMDDLHKEENKVIYDTMARVSEVPVSVIGDLYQKAFLFIKALPDKANVSNVLDRIISSGATFIEYLDNEFVEKSLLVSTTVLLSNYSEWSYSDMFNILSSYLLCSKDSEIQMKKYNNLVQPVLEACKPKWAKGEKYLIDGIQHLLEQICSKIPDFVYTRKMQMPVEIFRKTRDVVLNGSFCVEEHYIMLRWWQLTVRYMEIIDEMKKTNDVSDITWESIRTGSVRNIASMCHDYISEDVRTFFPSIYILFRDAMTSFLKTFEIKDVECLLVLYEMLSWKDCVPIYLLVLDVLPDYGRWQNDCEGWKIKIKKRIYLHPSIEIKMHYFRRFGDKYTKDTDA